ncbi:transcriptional regulator [Streptomyces sp. MUM 136J]|uniref:transcriptional regulator n=1 Tax=Streptomyces sp. MUM 136J TaxID=2791992 RepID=UPI001F0382FB|nr:transcriptional regulator [Streptomyces sp. MUM 136J]MCH0569521.1 transcriptional regulator [Streptomyces sp. MUM 136J]
MTVVEAPPPLPVRDKTTRERAGVGLSPMLNRLAAEQATGVLVREGGSLHLAGGRVLHAESRFAAGLGTLLTAHGALTTEEWWTAVGEAGDLAGTARLLLAGGHLTRAAVQICHLQSLYDAAYFALAPGSGPGRFHYGVVYPGAEAEPGGPLPAVPVADVEREVVRRRSLLHKLWPDALADSEPLVRTDPIAAPALTPRQAAVLALVDGVRTAPDIALVRGGRAFPTLVEVRRLVAAGLLTTPPPPPPPPPAGEPPGPPMAAPVAPPADFDPHIALLKRVRDALEAL